MSVQAKLFVKSIHEYTDSSNGQVTQKTVTMNPVYGDSEENKTWSKWTPSGEVSLAITNPDAYNQFKIGQVVLATFEPA